LVMRRVLRRDALLAWSGALAPCVMAMEACGGRRANWFLPGPGKYVPVVKYSVPDPPFPPDTRVPPGVVWTGELVAAPVTLELPSFSGIP
jgi:hypothetical protein